MLLCAFAMSCRAHGLVSVSVHVYSTTFEWDEFDHESVCGGQLALTGTVTINFSGTYNMLMAM